MKNPVSASDMAQGSQISDNNPARNWNGNATASLAKKQRSKDGPAIGDDGG